MLKSSLLCAALVLGLACSASAAEMATTSELPAALRALKPATAKILSTKEASKIRGEGGKIGPHSPGVKFPGNKYTGNRTGQDLKPGFGGLK
jgi:hypothetical protein